MLQYKMFVFFLALKWYFICHCVIVISQAITKRKKVTSYRDVYNMNMPLKYGASVSPWRCTKLMANSHVNTGVWRLLGYVGWVFFVLVFFFFFFFCLFVLGAVIGNRLLVQFCDPGKWELLKPKVLKPNMSMSKGTAVVCYDSGELKRGGAHAASSIPLIGNPICSFRHQLVDVIFIL